MLDIWASKPQSATRKGTCRISQWKRCTPKLAYDFCRVFQRPFACMNDLEIKQIFTRANKLFLRVFFLGLGIEHILTTVFVDTRLWKTKHPRKRFQNFRQSYVLSTDRIEIHHSQPLVWPSDLLYVMLAGFGRHFADVSKIVLAGNLRTSADITVLKIKRCGTGLT